ncbi:MAG: Multidrug resistance transporter, Bcr/CflA family, partial [uncultured Thermomicrobiales bacterium]
GGFADGATGATGQRGGGWRGDGRTGRRAPDRRPRHHPGQPLDRRAALDRHVPPGPADDPAGPRHIGLARPAHPERLPARAGAGPARRRADQRRRRPPPTGDGRHCRLHGRLVPLLGRPERRDPDPVPLPAGVRRFGRDRRLPRDHQGPVQRHPGRPVLLADDAGQRRRADPGPDAGRRHPARHRLARHLPRAGRNRRRPADGRLAVPARDQPVGSAQLGGPPVDGRSLLDAAAQPDVRRLRADDGHGAGHDVRPHRRLVVRPAESLRRLRATVRGTVRRDRGRLHRHEPGQRPADQPRPHAADAGDRRQPQPRRRPDGAGHRQPAGPRAGRAGRRAVPGGDLQRADRPKRDRARHERLPAHGRQRVGPARADEFRGRGAGRATRRGRRRGYRRAAEPDHPGVQRLPVGGLPRADPDAADPDPRPDGL